ncbi:MAG: GlsB/YeaQ/YmgE family stress response membrane protein [Solirubrobacteraceae bacterium]|nr:GlsB/YeaQ/YmgE family stress response membrane protein [Patulibacter sp.]
MIGAIILGLVAGAVGKLLVPGDQGGGIIGTMILGLVGALVGYFIFTRLLGIGDHDAFDLGGLLSAIIGVVIVLLGLGALGRGGRAHHA